MNSDKKKSSGWRPPEKRGTPQRRQARQDLADAAEARSECDRLRLWRCCPARKCWRVRGCTGDARQCIKHRTPKTNNDTQIQLLAESPSRTAAAIENQPRGLVLSAAEAAAAIGASIANVSAPAPPPGEEWQAIVRDGRVHYVPRGRSE
jgi:hypothetical protein